VTTVSQFKICDFSGKAFKGFKVLYFSMATTTTQMLSSGEFCKLRYDTIPVKSASENVLSLLINTKCQILSCDTLVANERYVLTFQTGVTLISCDAVTTFCKLLPTVCREFVTTGTRMRFQQKFGIMVSFIK